MATPVSVQTTSALLTALGPLYAEIALIGVEAANAATSAAAALASANAAAASASNLFLQGLPTTLPGSPGVYWINGGIVCKS